MSFLSIKTMARKQFFLYSNSVHVTQFFQMDPDEKEPFLVCIYFVVCSREVNSPVR